MFYTLFSYGGLLGVFVHPLLITRSEDVLLPLSNVFYCVVIAVGPVINNLFVKIKILLFLL
jgi:hypothetical protein